MPLKFTLGSSEIQVLPYIPVLLILQSYRQQHKTRPHNAGFRSGVTCECRQA